LNTLDTQALLPAVQFNRDGLVPVIAQCASTHQVLMFAWMNEAALLATIERGEAVYFSRSRNKLWHKGEESGNVQTVKELRLDCDGDVLLMSVEQAGGIACHTGRANCFYRKLDGDTWREDGPVLRDPAEMYKKGKTSELPE